MGDESSLHGVVLLEVWEVRPLSPDWVIAVYSLSLYKVSRIIAYGKYGEQVWLKVTGSITQPI